MLLYPHHGELPSDPILERYSIAKAGARESLFVATLDVSGRRREHENALRHLILDRLDVAAAA